MKTQFIWALSLLVGVFFITGALAQKAAHHGDEGHHDSVEGEVIMPASISGIWHEIEEEETLLQETIEEEDLNKVHKRAFKIRDLVKALVNQSTSLEAQNLEKAENGSKRIAQIADLLDQYGDAGDKEKTQVQFNRLAKVLKYIQSQYPEGTLKSEDSEDHEEEHVHH